MTRTILDLVEAVGRLPLGATASVRVDEGIDEGGEAALAAAVAAVAAWCAHSGNELVSLAGGRAVVRRGRGVAPDAALAGLPADRRPGARLWVYTNFDCNLACDYCCSRSSPQALRRAMTVEQVRRLAVEAASAGVREIYLTGGEPFLLPDLDAIVAGCTVHLPTTLLTNGMLFRGRRLDMLRHMDRDRLTLQISLDSANPARHDRHRGAGSWQRALDGVRTAIGEGFRVRVAATVVPGEEADTDALHALLDGLGIDRADQVVRPVARRGFATDGVDVTVETVVPEITVTSDGVYWHPVAADHPDQLVSRRIFPLSAAIDEVHRRFGEYRRAQAAAADLFPCA